MNALVPTQSDPPQPPPRQPRNLQGLLAYSMQARGNAPPQEALHPLSPQDRQWLSEALSSCTVNVVEEMNKAIQILKEQQNDVETYERALDNLCDYVDNADVSNDFHKIGGFTVFPSLLHSEHRTLRSKSANLLAELTQNNPYCQERALDLQPALLKLISSDPCQEVRVKALYALSSHGYVLANTASCLRDYPPSLEPFLQHDGLSALLCALQSASDKLRIKAAFLLSSLCSQNPQVRVQVHKMGMVEQLTALLQSEGQPHEHLLSALLALVRDHPGSLEECRRPHLRLRETKILNVMITHNDIRYLLTT
ncbi:hypothetical protein B566_EDAN009797 [Ephemera danica]|nr:hypothetical protein B566_EDAN009797 [Ephemera danica]